MLLERPVFSGGRLLFRRDPAPAAPDIWRELDSFNGPIDFVAWFGAARPVEIEIGCGKGGFLATVAELHPEINFVGVEKDGRYLKRARRKIEKRGLRNVRLVHGDMVYMLLNHVPDGAIQAYHVYFPDPWPKRRHAKRRMFTDLSVEQFARTLRPGHELVVKTDVPVNFTRMRRVVEDSGLFALDELRCWRGEDAPPNNLPTNFETKYRKIGKEVFYARWRVK